MSSFVLCLHPPRPVNKVLDWSKAKETVSICPIIDLHSMHEIQWEIKKTEVDSHPLMHTPLSLLTTFVLAMAMSSGIFTSNSNHSIFVHKCIQIINVVKFSQAVYKISHSQTFWMQAVTEIYSTWSTVPWQTDGSKGTKTVEVKWS